MLAITAGAKPPHPLPEGFAPGPPFLWGFAPLPVVISRGYHDYDLGASSVDRGVHNVRVGADQTSGRGPALAWQEELRKLDEELASGRITAENYRIRRDAVLASAATSPQAPPPNAAESTAMIPPVTGNAPPPANADRTQVVSTGDAADKTQIVSGNALPNSERTQAVRPGWNQQQPQGGWGQQIPGVPQQQGMRGMPPSPPRGVPQQNPPQQQQPQQQGWESGGGDSGTPWGGSEFPPLNYGSGNQDWIKQGPEVFGESSGGSKKWLIIVIVVVVVLGLGAGGYFLFFNKPSSTASHGGSTSTSTTAPTTTKPKPPDPLAIAQLPGTVQDQSGIQNFSDVVQAQLLTSSELTAYQTEGASGTRLATSTLSNGDHLTVMTVQVNSATSAGTAVTTLVALQQTTGEQAFTGTVPAGVQATQIGAQGQTPNLIRGHYASKNVVVRIQVYGPSDMSTLAQEFNQLVAAQLKLLPANG